MSDADLRAILRLLEKDRKEAAAAHGSRERGGSGTARRKRADTRRRRSAGGSKQGSADVGEAGVQRTAAEGQAGEVKARAAPRPKIALYDEAEEIAMLDSLFTSSEEADSDGGPDTTVDGNALSSEEDGEYVPEFSEIAGAAHGGETTLPPLGDGWNAYKHCPVHGQDFGRWLFPQVHDVLDIVICNRCEWNTRPYPLHTDSDEESDSPSYNQCTLCRDGGDLICCSNCPHVFHAACLQHLLGGSFVCLV